MSSSLIDTVRLRADIDHRDWLARQQRLFKAGRITPISRACSSHIRRFAVSGAYGSKATVQSVKNGMQLVIECSIPRFLTGQNVFGTENLKHGVRRVTRLVCKQLGISTTEQERAAVRNGNVDFMRIDVTAHVKCPSDADAKLIMKAMRIVLAFGEQNFSAYKCETLYVNQSSDSHTLKIYLKGLHVAKFPPPLNMPHRAFVLAASRGLLRFELTMRRRFLLANGMGRLKDWDGERARAALRKAVADLELRNVQLKRFKPQASLSNIQNLLLALHMDAMDVSTVMACDRQRKEHAAKIRKATGVDISIPYECQAATRQADLESLLERLSFGEHARAVKLGLVDVSHGHLPPATRVKRRR